MTGHNKHAGPTCESCGAQTNDVSDTERGVICWCCLDDADQQAADRAYDEQRDHEMEEK